MIKEAYCSFEVAKLLKEKGFDEPCYRWYDAKGDVCAKFINPDIPLDYSSREYYLCPSQSMTMKWLREVHNLFIELYAVKNYSKKKLEYIYSIQDLDFQGSDDGIECCKNWDTPEQACEIAIKYCLEKLI